MTAASDEGKFAWVEYDPNYGYGVKIDGVEIAAYYTKLEASHFCGKLNAIYKSWIEKRVNSAIGKRRIECQKTMAERIWEAHEKIRKWEEEKNKPCS